MPITRQATGHADFVESTDAVLNLTCVACGKPCRSETEKDIHTKRTGHSEFVDKTNETAAAIDSEKEMKKLDADIKAELGVEGSSPMDVDSNPVDDPDEEKIEPEVDAKCLAELEGMGFNRNRAVRALYHTGTDNVEQAVNWIVEHENDADVDDAAAHREDQDQEEAHEGGGEDQSGGAQEEHGRQEREG